MLDTELALGSRLKLSQETDYPRDGLVTIRVHEAPRSAFSIKLRVPGWADGASLAVNGRPWPNTLEPASYVELHRAWSPGDVVELTLPMRVRVIQAHPLVEELRNQVAFQRGPIVYCLESTDLPEGVRILDVRVPREGKWTPRFDPAVLGGAVVLEGRAGGHSRASLERQPLPRATDRRPSRDRPLLDPVSRLGQSRPLRDDRMAAARLVRPAMSASRRRG